MVLDKKVILLLGLILINFVSAESNVTDTNVTPITIFGIDFTIFITGIACLMAILIVLFYCIQDNQIYLFKGKIPKVIGHLSDDFVFGYLEEERIKDELKDILGFEPKIYIKGELVYIKDNKKLKLKRLKKIFDYKTKQGLWGLKFIVPKNKILKKTEKEVKNE